MKFIISLLALCLLCCVALSWALLSSHSLVDEHKIISASEVAAAKNKVKELSEQLLFVNKKAAISLNKDDLSLISQFVSQTVPRVALQVNLSSEQLYVTSSYKVDILSMEGYINLQCLFFQGAHQVDIDGCSLGSLKLPRKVVTYFASTLLKTIFSPDQVKAYTAQYQKLELARGKVILKTDDVSTLKLEVKDFSQQLFNVGRKFTSSEPVNLTKVKFYLDFIETFTINDRSVAPYLIHLFQEVAQQSVESNAILESESALWAFVIAFGNDKFAKYIGLNYRSPKRFQGKILSKRRDLALHFLYSIFLELSGKNVIAEKIGEYKELLDSNQGGSGFSFADLAADFAGVEFSKRLTTEPALTQKILSRIVSIDKANEALFFPSIKGFPEGISQKRFVQLYDNSGSEAYQKMTNDIYYRINQLYIYQ